MGPTGVGKTDLGLEIAREFEGQVISADSVQVYKGLDIIAGKDIPSGYSFTSLSEFSTKYINAGYYSTNSCPRIYLLDVVDPTFSFNASSFVDLADSYIKHISQNKQNAIIVGGTGLYVNSLIYGIDTAVGPNSDLRNTLVDYEIAKLQSMIPNEVLLRMNNSDRLNKSRLMRAIELTSEKTSPIPKKNKPLRYDAYVIGLSADRQLLKDRIDKRVAKRLEDGALEEVNKLYSNYERLSSQVKNANGYRQLFSFLKKEIDLDEAIYRWRVSEYRHAKNQMTWFRKYGNVEWFDISDKRYKNKIKNNLKKFLQ